MFSLHSLMDISNLPELCQEFIEELVRLHSTGKKRNYFDTLILRTNIYF